MIVFLKFGIAHSGDLDTYVPTLSVFSYQAINPIISHIVFFDRNIEANSIFYSFPGTSNILNQDFTIFRV